MSDPTRSAVLAELAREVRGDTLRILAATGDEELTWAPAGTTNHILWHAGHAVWLQDVLCVRLLTGHAELPDGWESSFGMGSRPGRKREYYPGKEELLDLLQAQLQRVEELLRLVPDGALDRPSPHASANDRRTLGHSVLHGWHDEAKHQGEMYLLLKMQRLGRRGP